MRVKHDYAPMAKSPNFEGVIRRERAARGLTKAEFGRLIGVSRVSVHDYEERGQVPKLEVAAEIAQRLGLSLDQLAGIAPRPSRSPDLADIARGLRLAAEVQSGLVSELQAAASRLVQLGGLDGASGTG